MMTAGPCAQRGAAPKPPKPSPTQVPPAPSCPVPSRWGYWQPPQALAGPRAPPSPTNGSFRSCSEPLPRQPAGLGRSGAQALPLPPQQVPSHTQQVRAKQNQDKGSEGAGQRGGRPARAQVGAPWWASCTSSLSARPQALTLEQAGLPPGPPARGPTVCPPGARPAHLGPCGHLTGQCWIIGLTLTLSGNDVQRWPAARCRSAQGRAVLSPWPRAGLRPRAGGARGQPVPARPAAT